MKLRILAEADCRALLGMREAIDVQAEAFRLLASGASVEGLRGVVRPEKPAGVTIFNPSFLREGRGYGVKVVSDYFGNSARGLPRMVALISLFDGETGLPTSVLEGGYITDLRTGAGTALAARHLARTDSRVLGVVGAGRVARNQIEALSAAFDLREIRVYARSRQRAAALQRVTLVETPEDAVRGADIVVAATTSSQPVVRGAWLAPGAFVAAVGAFAADMRELDDEVIRRAGCHVIDSRADVLPRAGDFLSPIKSGSIAEDQVSEIAEILSGKRPGRRSPEEITVYKSSGVPIQDLVTAREIERRAIERGVGTVLDIGGDHD
jgi:ornithine cyclodeaminase/alanine dehydrogenase-like protein (mu-crystallin family)